MRWIPATKRIMDLLFSITILLLFSPVIAVIAILIKLTSPGPIIYKQKRIRMNCNMFINSEPDAPDEYWIYKFRTMVVDAEKDTGAKNAEKDDPRVTGIGRFLRKTRLDELPNLMNVVRGEMSVVGPRADRVEIINTLSVQVPYIEERVRLIKPGITGLAQLKLMSDGTLGSDKHELVEFLPDDHHDVTLLNDIPFKFKLYYDFAYMCNTARFWSFIKTDIMIILKTPYVMFFRKNVI